LSELSIFEVAKKQLVSIKNRRAEHDFAFIARYKAGIVLSGSEVKSVRKGKVNLGDAYCYIHKGELWIKNLHISEYFEASYNNHEPRALRKLLLTKKELQKLQSKIKEKGLTIVPIEMFESERSFIKLEIALAKGKKSFDKRDSIKEKEQKRTLDRMKVGR
jgi:SsrA-binding protein